jgi:hypothetical protein
VSKKYWDEIEMPLGMSWRTSWGGGGGGGGMFLKIKTTKKTQ